MILASSLRRASEEQHSSTALNRLGEALFLPWSVSMSSDEPYWRPPTPRSVWSFSWRLYGLEARFWTVRRNVGRPRSLPVCRPHWSWQPEPARIAYVNPLLHIRGSCRDTTTPHAGFDWRSNTACPISQANRLSCLASCQGTK